MINYNNNTRAAKARRAASAPSGPSVSALPRAKPGLRFDNNDNGIMVYLIIHNHGVNSA